MTHELVSVIVPIYKVELYLDKCIQSIVNQTYDNLEIILVDDGSPDRCGEICDEWAKKDSRIRVFHQKNQGVSVARNVGLQYMNGIYFTCIDPDDFWHTDYIKEMLLGAKKTNAFVVPSEFTLKKLNEFGIPQKKLNHIPTFFNLKQTPDNITYEPYFLFVGRIEKQKGLQTLIDAFTNTDLKLKIIGFSNSGYEEELKNSLNRKKHHIEFLGKKTFEEIEPYLQTCLCTIVPSEWYDNFPNVILESFAYKKPVIATNFGSLPELVIEGETGLLFNYQDSKNLIQKCNELINHPDKSVEMGQNAYKHIETLYSPKTHYSTLIEVFQKVLK